MLLFFVSDVDFAFGYDSAFVVDVVDVDVVVAQVSASDVVCDCDYVAFVLLILLVNLMLLAMVIAILL